MLTRLTVSRAHPRPARSRVRFLNGAGCTACASARRSAVIVAAGKKVFIDGEAGTTGLQVRAALAKRDDIEIISLVGDDRKDAAKEHSLFLNKPTPYPGTTDDAAVEATTRW